MRGIIVVDVGTTSIRASLYDEHGNVVAAELRDNPPTYFPDGRVEQEPSAWRKKMFSLLSACAERAREISLSPAAVALTAQRSSVIAVDSQGEPLRSAIMWQDKRTDEICSRLQGFVPEVFARTGTKISPVFSAAKMRWIRDNEPDLYKRTGRMVGIQDFLIHSLTGAYVTDHTFASRTNLMNLVTRAWDDELLRIFGIEKRLLCDLIPPGSVAGTVTEAAAAASGLPSGLPVISAGGDQNCAALGQGVFDAGALVANTGTGSYLIAHSERPVFDPGRRLNCNASAIPGAFIVEAAVLTSGSIYRWFTERFYDPPAGSQAAAESDAVFQLVNTEATMAPVGSDGVFLLPYFKGAGSPWWNPRATGSFLNLTLGTTRADMARAVLEGIAAELRENAELIQELTGPVTTVSISGGLTSLRLFNQIQADMMNKVVFLHHFAEATSVGAWINAVAALGIHASRRSAFEDLVAGQHPTAFSPDPRAVEVYTKLANRRRAIAQLMESSGFYDG